MKISATINNDGSCIQRKRERKQRGNQSNSAAGMAVVVVTTVWVDIMKKWRQTNLEASS